MKLASIQNHPSTLPLKNSLIILQLNTVEIFSHLRFQEYSYLAYTLLKEKIIALQDEGHEIKNFIKKQAR